MPQKVTTRRDQLTSLEQVPNVGPATADDLRRLGIEQPKQLRGQDPFALYERLCRQDGKRYDPCLLDVLIAATEFMNGKPKRPWWKYTPKRKREMARREQAAGKAGTRLGRRALLAGGVLTLFAPKHLLASATPPASRDDREELRFSVLTDLHYADKPPSGTRYYRETLPKLADARQAIEKFQPHFVVELGDVIDAAESVEQEREYLETIDKQLESLPGDNHYVVGNHCVYSLTKPEFLKVVGQEKTYYSFAVRGYHLIVLDACFRSDGEPYGRKNFQWTDSNLSEDELAWLEADLKKTTAPTIVFIHQRLDVEGHYGVKNAAKTRRLLEQSGRVELVCQGHNHTNDYKEIGAIPYVTFAALVEGSGPMKNAFANVRVDKRGDIHISGYGQQKSYEWTGGA